MVQVRESSLSGLSWVSIVLVVIGALNWGLVGLFNVNVVALLFGPLSPISRIIYVLVGLAGLHLVYITAQLSQRARV